MNLLYTVLLCTMDKHYYNYGCTTTEKKTFEGGTKRGDRETWGEIKVWKVTRELGRGSKEDPALGNNKSIQSNFPSPLERL